MLKSTKSMDKQSEQTPKCICYRKVGTVICSSCDYICSGRILKDCQIHKNCTFLFDRSVCVNCGAGLASLIEIPMNFKEFQQKSGNFQVE